MRDVGHHATPPGSLFPALREDVAQMLRALGLSQMEAWRTHLNGVHDQEAHDEESHEAPKRELLDGDAEQCGEASVSVLRSQERDEQGGRRILPLDAVPLVRLAHGTEGDVAAPYRLGGYVLPLADRREPSSLWRSLWIVLRGARFYV